MYKLLIIVDKFWVEITSLGVGSGLLGGVSSFGCLSVSLNTKKWPHLSHLTNLAPAVKHYNI